MRKFDTKDLTMSSLIISDEIIIEVPVNQRKYSWGNDQVETYWDDIMTTRDTQEVRHYLGVISLITKEKVSIDLTKYELIDGQQRLITTLLFIAALRDVSISITDGEMPRKIQKKYLSADTNRQLYPKLKTCKIDAYTFDNIVNVSLNELENDIKFVESLNNEEKVINSFKRIIKENNEEPINKKMLDAYEFFIRKISSELRDRYKDGKDLILDFLDILSKLEIIEVISDNISNMFLYFDSLNNRGLHLNSMDIIRNNFFKVISERFNDKIDYYGDLWDNLVLKLDGYDCGKFLKYYLMCEQAIICSAKDLPLKYDELFKKTVSNETMSEQIRKILDYAQIYIKIFDKCSDIKHIDKINFLGQQACHSFIMDYFYHVDDEERRVSILNLIERMIFRRIICTSSTKQLDGIFRDMIKTKKIDEESKKINYNDDKINKLIMKNTPDESQFVNAFNMREWSKDNTTIYVLYKYETHRNKSLNMLINNIKSDYYIEFISYENKKNSSLLKNIILIENDILNGEKFSFIDEINNMELLKKSRIQSVCDLYKNKDNLEEYVKTREDEIKEYIIHI